MSAAAQISASAAVLDLTFDAESHTYYWNGARVCGVTNVLKDALLVDYSGIPRAILDAAAERGRNVHLALEYYDHGTLDEERLAPEYQGYLEAYKRFCQDTGFVVGYIETRRYQPQRHYAGTFDRTGYLPNSKGGGTRWLVDFKTGMFQDGHFAQLAAYANLLPDPRSFRCMGLQLSADATYKIHELPAKQLDYYTQLFNCALVCAQHRLGKGKS
jgi:hypothetical protein